MGDKIILGTVDRMPAMAIAHQIKTRHGMDKLASLLLTAYATCDHDLLERFKANCRVVFSNNGAMMAATLADIERLQLPPVATQFRLF